jgi:membrane-anchored glycerophosphoryl diester phosphodiesterase (GDPDase)
MLWFLVGVVVAVIFLVLIWRLLLAADGLDPFMRQAIMTVIVLVVVVGLVYYFPGRLWP